MIDSCRRPLLKSSPTKLMLPKRRCLNLSNFSSSLDSKIFFVSSVKNYSKLFLQFFSKSFLNRLFLIFLLVAFNFQRFSSSLMIFSQRSPQKMQYSLSFYAFLKTVSTMIQRFSLLTLSSVSVSTLSIYPSSSGSLCSPNIKPLSSSNFFSKLSGVITLTISLIFCQVFLSLLAFSRTLLDSSNNFYLSSLASPRLTKSSSV